MIKRLFSSVLLPLAWLIAIQVLLCLPGNDLPSEEYFIPHFDKIVHAFLFGGFTAVWCYYYYLKGKPASKLKTIFFVVYLLVCINGIVLEFVQRDYIPFRSFDLGDIIADVLAASVAYGLCNIKLITTTT